MSTITGYCGFRVAEKKKSWNETSAFMMLILECGKEEINYKLIEEYFQIIVKKPSK